MNRRLFNFAAVVSLIWCVASAMLWARSYHRRDEFSRQRGPIQQQISSDFGRIGYVIFHIQPSLEQDYGWRWSSFHPLSHSLVSGPYEQFERCGVGWARGQMSVQLQGRTYTMTAREWSVRYWVIGVVAAVLLLLPAWRLRAELLIMRRHIRARAGRCTFCGYDLRATPQRCPECGTVAAKQRMKDEG
jgi:hypothetical protein